MSVTVEEIKNIGFLNLSLKEKIQINLWTPFEKCIDTPLLYLLIGFNKICDVIDWTIKPIKYKKWLES